MSFADEEDHIIGLKKIAMGAGWIFFGLMFVKILAYFYNLVLARLGPEQYGLFNLGLSITAMVASISVLGLHTGVLRYVSFYKGKLDEQRIKGTIVSALQISLPTSIIFFCILFLISPLVSINIFHNPKLIPILRLFSITIPFLVLLDIFLPIFAAFQKIKYRIYKDLFQQICLLSLTFIFICLGYKIKAVVLVYILSVFCAFVLSAYFLEKRVFPIFKTKVKSIYTRKELFSYSWPLLFNEILYLILTYTDIFMIGYFLTTSSVGIYNIAIIITSLLQILPQSLLALFSPVITERYAQEKDIKKTYKTVSKWVFCANLPICLIIVLFSRRIILMFFGERYILGALPLSILTIAYLFSFLFSTSTYVLHLIKKTKLISSITLIAAISNIILNWILIPLYGITGAAVATAICLIISPILAATFSYRLMKLQPFSVKSLKAALAGITAMLIVYNVANLELIKRLEIHNSYLIFFFIAFLILYLLLFIIFGGIDEEDRIIISAIQKKTNIKLIFLEKFLDKF